MDRTDRQEGQPRGPCRRKGKVRSRRETIEGNLARVARGTGSMYCARNSVPFPIFSGKGGTRRGRCWIGRLVRRNGPTQVKKILSRTRDRPLGEVRRPWYRVRRRVCSENILVLARKNYEVYTDIGPMVGLMRILSVLDTCARPNLVRKSEFPAGMETPVSFGPTQDIGDANTRSLRTLGTI